MKLFENYYELLRTERSEINAMLKSQIAIYFNDSYFSSQVEACVLPGRKVRSILLSKTLQQLNPTFDVNSKDNVIFSIEVCHAASVLVDDVIDSDQYRHGSIATEVLWGSVKSILFSHLMTNSAISALQNMPGLQKELLSAYRQMSIGEIYDTFSYPGEWIDKGYNINIYQKTTALFRFSFLAANHLSNIKVEGLEDIGHYLGILYQLSNDYYDWQIHNLHKRHSKLLSWPITFSFPLSVYIQKYQQHAILEYIKKRNLTYEEWEQFLGIIWNDAVNEFCMREIKNTQKILREKINRSSISAELKNLYIQFSEIIAMEEYWYHDYQQH